LAAIAAAAIWAAILAVAERFANHALAGLAQRTVRAITAASSTAVTAALLAVTRRRARRTIDGVYVVGVPGYVDALFRPAVITRVQLLVPREPTTHSSLRLAVRLHHFAGHTQHQLAVEAAPLRGKTQGAEVHDTVAADTG